MNSQETQEEKRDRLASDTPVPTEMWPGGDVSLYTDRRPGKKEDGPRLEPQQRQKPTKSQNKGDIKQEKDRHQGKVHRLDPKSIPPAPTNENAEWMQQQEKKKSDSRQEKNRNGEQAGDDHRSESVVHGHLNPNVEEAATASQSVQAKKQQKDSRQGVHRLDSKSIPPGHTNENAEWMQQQDKKSDSRQKKNRDGEQAGDDHRSDSESVVHGQEEATTSQSVQAKKQEKDRRQGKVHRLISKWIPPTHTNKNAECMQQQEKKKSDSRQEKNRDRKRSGDDHGSESVVHGHLNPNMDEATTSQSVQAKKPEKDRHQRDVHISDSKLDPSKHIYEDVQDYHRSESETSENVLPGGQRKQSVIEGEKHKKRGLQGDKGRSVPEGPLSPNVEEAPTSQPVQNSLLIPPSPGWENISTPGDKRRPNVTLVLLGQSGSGKSASGNTILGKEVFESYLSSVPVTTQCKMDKTQISGIQVTVIDTPDFFSDDFKERDKALENCKSLIKTTTDHKYLLVMQLGRFTDGERKILPQIKEIFDREVVQNLIILFTHAKELGEKTLKEYIDKTDTNLQDVINESGSRYCAFENTVKNSKQVSGLFKIICEMEGLTMKKAENKECCVL